MQLWGFSNLLVIEDDLPDEEKADFINTINTNCELLLKLINDILELSRIESGNMTFSYSTCNLNNWVDSMYLTHSLLIPKEIEVHQRSARCRILHQYGREPPQPDND